VILLAAVFAAVGRPAIPRDDRTYYADHASPFVAKTGVPTHARVSWRFAGRLAAGWSARPAATVQPDNGETTRLGIHVLTSATPEAVNLRGPAVSLPAGRYRLLGSGRVLVGGLTISVRNAATGAAVGHGNYWWLQGDYLNNALAAGFVLHAPTDVRVTLSNWTTFGHASSWVLWSLSLQRLGASPTAESDHFYAASADDLVPAASLKGRVLEQWPFTSGTPQNWAPVGSPTQSITTRGLALETSDAPSGYQLSSTPLTLEPGSYLLSVRGRVTKGGIELGVLNNERNHWVIAEHYWSGQPFASDSVMTAHFKLAQSTRVQFIFSNWADAPKHSAWVLREVDLLRAS
jgi:hypothetical protein